MYTLEEIQKQLNDCGATDFFGTKKEIKELPNELQDNETIFYATSGMVDGNTYLIVCTNLRVIFLDKGMLYGLKKISIPLQHVKSVSFEKGLLLGKIKVHHGSAYMEVSQIDKNTVSKMAQTIQTQSDILKNLSYANSPLDSSTSVQDTYDNLTEELKKVKNLFDNGLITEEEFKAKKAKLLDL